MRAFTSLASAITDGEFVAGDVAFGVDARAIQAEAHAAKLELEIVRLRGNLADSEKRRRDTAQLFEQLSVQNGNLRSQLDVAKEQIVALAHAKKECDLKHGYLLTQWRANGDSSLQNSNRSVAEGVPPSVEPISIVLADDDALAMELISVPLYIDADKPLPVDAQHDYRKLDERAYIDVSLDKPLSIDVQHDYHRQSHSLPMLGRETFLDTHVESDCGCDPSPGQRMSSGTPSPEGSPHHSPLPSQRLGTDDRAAARVGRTAWGAAIAATIGTNVTTIATTAAATANATTTATSARVPSEIDALRAQVWQLEQDLQQEKRLCARLRSDVDKGIDGHLENARFALLDDKRRSEAHEFQCLVQQKSQLEDDHSSLVKEHERLRGELKACVSEVDQKDSFIAEQACVRVEMMERALMSLRKTDEADAARDTAEAEALAVERLTDDVAALERRLQNQEAISERAEIELAGRAQRRADRVLQEHEAQQQLWDDRLKRGDERVQQLHSEVAQMQGDLNDSRVPARETCTYALARRSLGDRPAMIKADAADAESEELLRLVGNMRKQLDRLHGLPGVTPSASGSEFDSTNIGRKEATSHLLIGAASGSAAFSGSCEFPSERLSGGQENQADLEQLAEAQNETKEAMRRLREVEASRHSVANELHQAQNEVIEAEASRHSIVAELHQGQNEVKAAQRMIREVQVGSHANATDVDRIVNELRGSLWAEEAEMEEARKESIASREKLSRVEAKAAAACTTLASATEELVTLKFQEATELQYVRMEFQTELETKVELQAHIEAHARTGHTAHIEAEDLRRQLGQALAQNLRTDGGVQILKERNDFKRALEQALQREKRAEERMERLDSEMAEQQDLRHTMGENWMQQAHGTHQAAQDSQRENILLRQEYRDLDKRHTSAEELAAEAWRRHSASEGLAAEEGAVLRSLGVDVPRRATLRSEYSVERREELVQIPPRALAPLTDAAPSSLDSLSPCSPVINSGPPRLAWASNGYT